VRLVLLSLIGFAGCEPAGPAAAPKVIAYLGDQPIEGHALMLRALRQYGELTPTDWLPILERLLEDEIDLRLLAREAQKQGISPSEDALSRALAALQSRYPSHRFRRTLDRLALQDTDLKQRVQLRMLAELLLGKEAASQPISREAIDAWIAKHPTEEKVVVRHLLTASKSEASEALGLFRKKRFLFADLVRRFSSAPEAEQGGILPAFSRGELPPVFDQAFSLKLGEVSEPLRSEHGWHVLRLERREAEGKPTDDRAQRDILRTREGALQGQLIARLRGAAKIRKVPGALAALERTLSSAMETP
jgi:peptidyl-prolyl cis-trans isomerase C/foldase protein PrsA